MKWLSGILTVIISTALTGLIGFFLQWAITGEASFGWGAIAGLIIGLLYGLEAGILTIYDASTGRGWIMMLADLTWSLPNTIFGFIFGNIIYIIFGNPSRRDSEGNGWIVFRPRSGRRGGFGYDVLQTLGTLNIGGAGQHERMHLLQARIFGPLYLVLFGANYVITALVQILWTFTIGGILWLAKVREKPYFEPPSESAVDGFFGWIYYSTVFELWAYAKGNP